MNKLIGICGRTGSGKSTISKLLCENSHSTRKFERITCPWSYILATLFPDWNYYELKNRISSSIKEEEIKHKLADFNKKETIYNLSAVEAFLKVKEVLKYPDLDFSELLAETREPMLAPVTDFSLSIDFVEVSFAAPLKKICCVLIQQDYEILLGETPEARELREKKIPDLNLSGREVLEIIGTNCFRMKFHSDFWINLARRHINFYQNVVVSDLRFENEFELISENAGVIVFVCRNPNDVFITQQDKLEHETKWKFLEYLDKHRIVCIVNDSDIETLRKKVSIFKK